MARAPVRPCLHRFYDGTACAGYTHVGSYCEVHRAEHQSPSTRVASTTKHRKKRARLMRELRMGGFMICPICEKPLEADDDLQLHHLTSVAITGGDGPSALTHKACNLREGGRLGQRLA